MGQREGRTRALSSTEQEENLDTFEVLLAERACERLTYQYCRLADEGNHARLADLFTEDGCFDLRDMRLEGRDRIWQVFAEREAVREFRTLHVCTNILIDVETPTEARGVVYVSLYRRRGPLDWTIPVPSTLPALVGTYHDTYARVDGTWLIRSRVQRVPFIDPADEGWALRAPDDPTGSRRVASFNRRRGVRERRNATSETGKGQAHE